MPKKKSELDKAIDELEARKRAIDARFNEQRGKLEAEWMGEKKGLDVAIEQLERQRKARARTKKPTEQQG